MKLDELTKRVDELIALGNAALATARPDYSGVGQLLDTTLFAEFRSGSLSFLDRTFGPESPFYKDFDSKVTDISHFYTRNGIGILKACRAEIAGGWIFTTRGLVSAEVFSDFLDMAGHLLGEHYKDPAAVMVGSVLEEHLRQLCRKSSIAIESTKPDGSIVPLKADTLNAELSKANVCSKLDQKSVTAWLDLRNKAAHGKYGEYTTAQVDLMLRGVTDFIARTPL